MRTAVPVTPASRRRALPLRSPSQQNKSPKDLLVPPVRGVPSFFPQSLWTDQAAGRVDGDEMTIKTTYRLQADQRLEVGKYVADPYIKDFSNPKYQPTDRSSLSTSQVSKTSGRSRSRSRSRSRAAQRPFQSSFDLTPSISDVDPEVTPTPSSPRRGAVVKVTYPVVEPIYPSSAASLFFPVYYSRPTVHDREDPRGLPQQINEELHPNDRPSMPLASVTVQKNNLNRMCLFKIGPGAVAFKVVINAFEAAGMMYTPSNSKFNVLWAKRATPYTLASLLPYQKVNHFPGTWGLGRKDCLAQNMSKMRRYFGETAFDIVPTSFLIPRQELELQNDAERTPDTPERPLIYIVKPSASSCGRGIELYRGVPPIPRGGSQMVCQRYIGNPLLIFGRKFDLRLYCVVTSFDPLRIYLFDEGLVRFAAQKYRGPDQDLDNIHMHLTNYSVNKTAELNKGSIGKTYDSEDAIDIKWCTSDLKKHLIAHHPEGIEAWRKIMKECDDVVIKAFLSIEHDVIDRVRAECRDKSGRNCFELFGLDLMADSDLKVRLIEVNIMPSLAIGTNLDQAVKSRMLAHLLTLIRVVPYRRDAPVNHSQCFVPSGAQPHFPERTYKFGNHPNASARIMEVPLLMSFNDPHEPESKLTAEETLMLVESEEEEQCAGGFRRIFPIHETVEDYLPFFTHGLRRNNFLLASAVTMRAPPRDADRADSLSSSASDEEGVSSMICVKDHVD